MPTKLGQNFLTDKSIVDRIVAAANLTANDFILEIGPGKGILTEKLTQSAGKVKAIELDKNLIETLQKKFEGTNNLELIESDILKLNITELVQNSTYRVIANIPYYITSPIIRLFLENKTPPEEMILMVQKEVAERIAAKPGEMSILAVAIQYYADPQILFIVPRTAFDPTPEVDSAVIKITKHKRQDHDTEFTQKFFQIVRAGFSAKRKTLVNNLAASLHSDKKEMAEKIKKASLPPATRAQELSIQDWKKLAQLF